MSTRKLLVEIGTEELPPKSLAGLGDSFAAGVAAGLEAAGVAAGDAHPYFSPRRLAVVVDSVAEMQPERKEKRTGPALKAAYDNTGKPTRAAVGFAASCGIPVEALERDDGRITCTVVHPGRPTAGLVGGIVTEALRGLPIARRMRWGGGDLEFVRPVHWIVMLFGDEPVPAELFGVHAGADSRGHRFHAPGPLRIASADDYPDVLRAHMVRVNDAARSLSDAVRAAARDAAHAVGGVPLGLDGELADEVAALNEWPSPIVGGFDAKYLDLPPEVLITTLEHHQRYFPVVGADDALLPYFVAFTNIESRNPEIVKRGNERVVVPRLEDAMFFWNQDRATTLAARRDALAYVAWQKKLGTLGDKVARVSATAAAIASRVNADPGIARRAGELCKCDLLTAMVGEFPELQGTMGMHYARHDGEPEAVAVAIGEHYLPRGAGDRLPETAAGRALAIADRLDSLVGAFATGQRPTGDKDPFGLRRAAAGVLRILIEGGLDADLVELLAVATNGLPDGLVTAGSTEELFDFVLERLRATELESGTRPDVFEAVAAVRPTRPADFVARLRAVNAFVALPEAAALAAANKRIANILKQAGRDAGPVDESLLHEDAERALAHELEVRIEVADAAIRAGDYTEALRGLAALRGPVDAFFDDVLVMADDEAVRDNRIALLAAVAEPFRRIADIGRLQLQ